MQRPLSAEVEQALQSVRFDARLVAEWVEEFDRDADMRAIMAIARRCGVPVSSVMTWSPRDLAAERAIDIWDAADAEHRCGHCGVHPDELNKANGRPAHGHQLWKLSVKSCDACEERHDLEERKDLKPWQRVVTGVRRGDEPFVPD